MELDGNPNMSSYSDDGTVLIMDKWATGDWDVLAGTPIIVVVSKRPEIRYVILRDRVLLLKGSLGKEILDIIAKLEGSLGVPVSDNLCVIEAELSRQAIRETISKYLGTDDTALEPSDYVEILKKIRKSKKA